MKLLIAWSLTLAFASISHAAHGPLPDPQPRPEPIPERPFPGGNPQDNNCGGQPCFPMVGGPGPRNIEGYLPTKCPDACFICADYNACTCVEGQGATCQ